MRTAVDLYIEALENYKKTGEYNIDSAIAIAKTLLKAAEESQMVGYTKWLLSKREIIQSHEGLVNSYFEEKASKQ